MLLTDEAGEVIKKSFQELGTQPQVASQIIKFLNSNSTEALIRKGVKDKPQWLWRPKIFLQKGIYCRLLRTNA
jgi:hypothetical protein